MESNRSPLGTLEEQIRAYISMDALLETNELNLLNTMDQLEDLVVPTDKADKLRKKRLLMNLEHLKQHRRRHICLIELAFELEVEEEANDPEESEKESPEEEEEQDIPSPPPSPPKKRSPAKLLQDRALEMASKKVRKE